MVDKEITKAVDRNFKGFDLAFVRCGLCCSKENPCLKCANETIAANGFEDGVPERFKWRFKRVEAVLPLKYISDEFIYHTYLVSTPIQ
jgi:hypothetical protein